MARSRSPDRDKAYELWRKSNGNLLLKEIAEQLNVSDSQIRKWKNQDQWVNRLKGNVTESNGNVTNRKGAPKRNKNAVGHGAPKGNRNAVGNSGGGPAGNKKAVTTGEHETIWMDALDEDERVLFYAVNTDGIAQVEQEIRLLEIRERRMLLRIQKLQQGPELVLSSETTSEQSNEKYGDSDSKSTTSEAATDRIHRIEEALTRVQDKKAKLIELKHKLLATVGEESDSGNLDELTAALHKSAEKIWGE